MALKGGRQMAQWETYYGGWMTHVHQNVLFLRFETLISSGCTQQFANADVVRRSRVLSNGIYTALNHTVWEFWNYSTIGSDKTEL